MSAFTPAQRHHAIGLYKRLLRTANETFVGDVSTRSAWRSMVRKEFLAARDERDGEKIANGLSTWEDVIKVLRHNVVQGEMNEKSKAFALQFRPETELGSNDSVKAARQKQLDDLRANKGSLGCGGGGGGVGASGSGSRSRAMGTSTTKQARAFSTNAVQQARSTSASSKSSAQTHVAKMADGAWDKTALPRPVPHFGQTVVFSDGSTIQLHTTSPRGTMRMTRDPTNHALWNPHLERRAGASDEDDSGRLARFRRRFGGAPEAAAASAPPEGVPDDVASSAAAAAAPSHAPRSGGYSTEDFDWMSAGGREAPSSKAAERSVKKGGKK